MTKLEEKRNDTIKNWKNYEEAIKNWFDNLIKQTIGEHWGVSRFCWNSVTFSVISSEAGRDFIFGQDIEIRRNTGLCDDEPERFTTNIASCGDSDIDKGEEYGDRAFYYVGLGKLLTSKDALTEIKRMLVASATKIENFAKNLKEIENKINEYKEMYDN